MKTWLLLWLACALLLALASAACGGGETDTAPPYRETPEVSGRVRADGSSTVAPLVSRAAEIFQADNPRARVTVGVSGTGGGFERFCAGETDISNASRPMDEEEQQACDAKGIEYVQLQVANDALTIITSNENDWAECLTTQQLSRIWQPGSKIERWNQVDPAFPNTELPLFGPGTASGTFDFFTEEINGREGASRSDYTPSEDDNDTVRGVARTEGGLGYLGFSYFEENTDSLKALALDGGEGCVRPGIGTAQERRYKPLSRALYMYVRTASLRRPAVKEFVRNVLADAQLIAVTGRLIPLTDRQLAQAERAFRRSTG